MTKTRKSFIIIGVLLIFTVGYSIGNENLPFNDSLKLTYQDIFQKNSEKNFENIDSIFHETDVDSLIRIESEEDIISKLDTINLRKINAVCNKKIQELTDENERMKDYNENVVLPGVSAFRNSTNEKIYDLESEIRRLKAKIKAYES